MAFSLGDRPPITASLKKVSRPDEGRVFVDSSDIRLLEVSRADEIVVRVPTEQAIEAALHDAPVRTPHGLYDVLFDVRNAVGKCSSAEKRFNYVFAPQQPLIEHMNPVDNDAFRQTRPSEVDYQEERPVEGYSSSDWQQPFDFSYSFVIRGAFSLDCDARSPTAFEINLCHGGRKGAKLAHALAFILGDGHLSQFSIKDADDTNQNRHQWRSHPHPTLRLSNDGLTLNEFLIVGSESRQNSAEVDCAIYLRVPGMEASGYHLAFKRTIRKARIPGPVMWLKWAAWKEGRIGLASLEVAEWDGREVTAFAADDVHFMQENLVACGGPTAAGRDVGTAAAPPAPKTGRVKNGARTGEYAALSGADEVAGMAEWAVDPGRFDVPGVARRSAPSPTE